MIQEQHAERCRLYAQWKQFDWPILQDPMTSIGLAVVPVAVLIDEHGIVMSTRPRPSQIEAMVKTKRPKPESAAPKLTDDWMDLEFVEKNSDVSGKHVEQAIWYGDVCLKRREYKKARDVYQATIDAIAPSEGKRFGSQLRFRLGVAQRAMFDESGNADDFASACKSWTLARAGNPNQYIWRRRIEQYGPRLIKPYPFYDWIDKAIEEVEARGEKPVPLSVPLTGSEIATPSKKKIDSVNGQDAPDPSSKIVQLDQQEPLVLKSAAVVPSRVKPGEAVRVHLQFFPSPRGKWNNESSPMRVWVNESKSGTPSPQLLEIENNEQATSKELRSAEFEFQTNADADSCVVTGYALFNVCSDEDGTCLYRRLNFQVDIPLDLD